MKTPNYSAHPLPGKPIKFLFTYALPDGAWLTFANGSRDWYCFAHIRHFLGQDWIDAQMRKTGIFTGCEITCAE